MLKASSAQIPEEPQFFDPLGHCPKMSGAVSNPHPCKGLGAATPSTSSIDQGELAARIKMWYKRG